MSPAHVLEPTYEAIKLRLKTGHWSAGHRLEAARLADDLGVSITPVRDSLWRLAGEQLVDFAPGEGFRVPRPAEAELRDLLELNCILLLAALAVTPASRPSQDEPEGGAAERTAALFLDLAARSGNGALVVAVAAINDRLYLARLHEAALLTDAASELAALEQAVREEGDVSRIRSLLLRYHHARAEAAGRLAQLIGQTQ